jgi:hypothetical protein
LSSNKQLQRTVTRRRGDGASAPLHYALAPRVTRQRAAAELRRCATGQPAMRRLGCEVLRALTLMCALITGALLPVVSVADTWRFPAILEETAYDFGQNKVIKIVDARQNTSYPDFLVKVVGPAGELLALYRDVSFEAFAVSEDGQVFVGISNRGLPQTAFFALGGKGALLFESKHHLSRLHYCDESVTLVRRWYDQDNPDVRFAYSGNDNQWLSSITLNGCSGERLDLQKLLVGEEQ